MQDLSDLQNQVKELERRLENSKEIIQQSLSIAKEAKNREKKERVEKERLLEVETELQIKRLQENIQSLSNEIYRKEKSKDEISFDLHLSLPTKIDKRKELQAIVKDIAESNKLLKGQQRLLQSLEERQQKNEEMRIAATRGNVDEVQRLLDLNVSCNVADATGFNAFKYACRAGNLKVVKLMINFSDINNEQGRITPLYAALTNQHWHVVRYLASNGANVNFVNEVGRSCLHSACSLGSFEGLDILLEFGAIIDQVDRLGNTCLHYCVMSTMGLEDTCRLEMASLLIEKGAKVNIRNIDNFIPRDLAKINKMYSILELIDNQGS